jgi:hypothetical protein
MSMRRAVGPSWIKAGFITLAFGQLYTGVWAVAAPASFYQNYPGWGWSWVRADGPFNEHLVVDAGAGFAAVGVALLIAALSSSRPVRLLALVTYVTPGLPHLAYHIGHVPETLGSVQGVLTWALLAIGMILGLVLLLGERRIGQER